MYAPQSCCLTFNNFKSVLHKIINKKLKRGITNDYSVEKIPLLLLPVIETLATGVFLSNGTIFSFIK
jgi:hypothetical protein